MAEQAFFIRLSRRQQRFESLCRQLASIREKAIGDTVAKFFVNNLK
jgi:hypothetical protein